MLFGDNAGDLFLLASEMCVSVASAGTINPAAATIAGNSLRVIIHELFEKIGIAELLPMKAQLMQKVKTWTDKKKAAEISKGQAQAQAKDEEKSQARELAKEIKKFGGNVKKLNERFGKMFQDCAYALESGKSQLEAVINACNKISTVLDLFAEFQNAFKALQASLKKPVNPVAVHGAVQTGKGFMDKVIGTCS
jgi:uncharacterized phage infection (PIP) family protein YhgE